MRDIFKSYDEFFGSDFYKKIWDKKPNKQDRVFNSTRLEDEIYNDLSKNDDELDSICEKGTAMLSTFQSLTRDIFTGFYSLSPKQRDETELSETSRRVNKPIVDKTIADDEFISLKNICEGRELISYDASVEFSEKIVDKLPELTESLRDAKTVETLQNQCQVLRENLQNQVAENAINPDKKRENKIVQSANRLHKKEKQISDLLQKSADVMAKMSAKIKVAVNESLQSAKEKAEETDNLIRAFGNDEADPKSVKLNEETLNKVRRNPKLVEISRIMGRYIKMIADKRKNSFEYGLGQKYDVSTGKNINLCLSSEIALLATKETQPLFVKKYMQNGLKQYRKREPQIKGNGDLIVCVDESFSMKELILWAKALAFALLDMTAKSNRKFALIRFSNDINTHFFAPKLYDSNDVITAIEGFFGGGTNFEKPLKESCRLIESEQFDNADIIFITDGICAISDKFAEYFLGQKASGFNVRGILLGDDAGGSLVRFCDKVYRLSEYGEIELDEIARQVIADKF